ncbi:helix-turn-helix transcriptional regulator [Bacillus solitudinis]|uniref:helix-turn-helix transcriptional regulator n=1 Tax=Bacillus solitudinis TaxID=2014074 RepID=UPI000C234FD8|nr:AraC family transcriptional regulator [Bacillus solitudinis]
MQNINDELLIHETVPTFIIQYKTSDITASNFHFHSGYEIVWLKQGEAKYIFEEKVYHLTKHHVLLFKSTEFHKVSLSANSVYERVVIMFTDEFVSFDHPILTKFKQFLEDLPLPHYVLHLFTWKAEQFQHIVDHLLREQENNQWEQKSALELYFLELLLYLGREIQLSYDPKSHLSDFQASKDVGVHERILKEINVIWDTDWCLENLADRLHFNKYYLCHFFKKEFGVTIYQYIQQRRIYEAKKMLINTDMPIHKLAKKVGFTSVSSFIRSFKNHVRMTPKKYRQTTNIPSLEF